MNKEQRDQKRQFWVVFTIVFLGFVGISAPYLIFPPLFLNAEYSFLPPLWGHSMRAFFLGLTLAVYPLGQFIGSPILGALSDDYGRRRLLSGSLVIASFCNLLTAYAVSRQHLTLLIISRFIAGLMEGNVAIARAMCADLKTLSKHETFGRMNAAISIAYIVGPFLGAIMTDKNLLPWLEVSTPFIFISILFLSLAILSSIILKESLKIATDIVPTIWERFNFIVRLRRLFHNKEVKVLLLSSSCFTLAVDVFYEFGPVYLTEKWHLLPSGLIVFNGIICLGLAVGNAWLPKFLTARTSSQKSIIVAMGTFTLILIAIVLTNSRLLMLIWCVFIGMSIGLAVTLLTVKISDAVSENKQGEVMGTQLSLRVLGDGIICLVGALLLMITSKIILIIAAGVALIAMGYYQLHSRKKQ